MNSVIAFGLWRCRCSAPCAPSESPVCPFRAASGGSWRAFGEIAAPATSRSADCSF